MKPSVLHVSPYYPPDRIGGVGEVVRVIHEGLIARGYQSAVLSSGWTRGDPKVKRIGRTPGWFASMSWLATLYARRFDVIHVHHGEALLLLLLLRLLRRRPRILLMLHVDLRRLTVSERPHTVGGRRFTDSGGVRARRQLQRFVRTLLDRLSIFLSDEVVVETHALVGELDDIISGKPIRVVPHGLPPPAAASSVEGLSAHLLYVGTPGLRKRTHLLPGILAAVRRIVPDVKLRIVGFDAKQDPRLVAEAHRTGVWEAFEFIGPQTWEETQTQYTAAAALVLPSAYEGLPMVLMEAMRAGLPVIATRVGGHAELIDHGVNGFLVPLDDPAGMAQACVDLLEDRVLRRRIGDAARHTITDRFFAGTQIDRFAEAYREVWTRSDAFVSRI